MPLDYVAGLYRIEFFFPAMLLAIGGRYLTFAPMFGIRLYWVCGAALALAGWALAANNAAQMLGVFAGSAIEAVFGVLLMISAPLPSSSSCRP